jgi:ssDNA-binding Zn-finger/Zn-ribbon topoisomerase 1
MWPGTQSPPRLQVQLPIERDVLHSLLIQRGSWFDHDDARHERIQVKPAVTNMQISDAGRKLRGLIDLFGGFWRARDYAERTFWQETFYRMAGRGARYDTNFQTETEQTIAKELKKFAGSTPESDRNKIAERVTNRVLARVGQRLLGVPLTAVEMENERARLENDVKSNPQAAAQPLEYLAGDTLVHMIGVTAVTREEFEEGLQDLVELSVMRMGTSVTCPRCRMTHWIEAERLKQADKCPGCGSAMPLVAETPWSYTLNPLVHHCVNHRVFAVWQALSYLSPRFGSFFHTPSSELYFAQPINGDPKREVDVICVTDGELLLGEVKTGGLHEKDFLDFAAITAAIRPDRAAMFIELDEFDTAKKWFGDFRKQLDPLGIRGQLFCLPNY